MEFIENHCSLELPWNINQCIYADSEGVEDNYTEANGEIEKTSLLNDDYDAHEAAVAAILKDLNENMRNAEKDMRNAEEDMRKTEESIRNTQESIRLLNEQRVSEYEQRISELKDAQTFACYLIAGSTLGLISTALYYYFVNRDAGPLPGVGGPIYDNAGV